MQIIVGKKIINQCCLGVIITVFLSDWLMRNSLIHIYPYLFNIHVFCWDLWSKSRSSILIDLSSHHKIQLQACHHVSNLSAQSFLTIVYLI